MRRNILILGHSYATQFIDVYNQYTRLFDPTQYHVTIAYLTGTENEEVRKRTLADDILFLNVPKKSIRGLKINPIRQLLKLCKERQFQLVICHRYKPSYIMMWVAQFYRIPALLFVMHELGTLSPLPRRLLIASLYRRNMIFAGVSDAVRNDMRQSILRVPQDRVVTLYNVIDVELTEPQLYSRNEAQSRLNLPNDAFIFGHLARLVPNKDQESLINAFALMKPHCPGAKLIIIGNGILEDQLKKQVNALHLENDILFTGYLSSGFRYMKAFDCFVLSSVQEAFGRVLLEAMIARCPIIATQANGIPEVMGNTGTLTEPRNVNALAQAMQTFYQLTATERQQLSDTAYQHLLAHYAIPSFQHTFWNLPLMKTLALTNMEAC